MLYSINWGHLSQLWFGEVSTATSPSFVFVYVLSFMLFDLAANTLVRSSSAGEISEASLVGV